ncbi:MAG: LysM peptidoglycan-binding domain-containing protein, partial [Planctomycetota bacterium]
MGRETKFGLLIGLVFIILFGVILSSRAGSSAPEHAALPTGESLAHATRLETVNRTVDPFKADAALDMNGQDLVIQVRSEGPAEEPLPAPVVALVSSDGGTVRTDDRGTVAFGPVTVETPAGAERAELRLDRAEPALDRSAAATSAASDPSRPVYVVRSGDTLIGIARRFYGKDAPRLWRQIADANKSTLRDPKRLAVGQKLVIPNVPQPPQSDAPRTDPPSGDVPRGTPLLEPARDTALAGGPAP